MVYSPNIVFPILSPLYFADPIKDTELTQYPKAFRYVQKWHSTDTVHIPFWFNTEETGDEEFYLKCIDAVTKRVLYTSALAVEGGLYIDGFAFYNVYASLAGIEGVVYFEIYDNRTATTLADSNFCEVGLTTDTILITYWNSKTDFDINFGTYSNLTNYTLRIEGGFIPNGVTPRSDRSVFTDQNQQDTLSYCMPYSEFMLTLGDSFGIPWYMGELLNFIFSCDVTILRNTQYQRTDADFEKKDTGNMTSVYTIPLKTKQNRFSQNTSGAIYITDKNGVYITDELGNKITL